MITTDREFYSSPYYFFLRDKGKDYSLYFSIEETLTEARKKDKMIKIPKSKIKKVKDYLEKLVNSKGKKNTEEVEGELDELVNADGNFSNSKIPILDPRIHPKKTMDQTVSAARITNDPISRGYRTYYGESVEEEVTEIDMSGAFGYEETEELDGKETYKYFKEKLDMAPEEAKERTKQQGKDPSGKKDKNSKFYKDKNFVTRATLSEIQKQKAIKMLEDILMNKKNSEKSDVVSNKESKKELPKTIKRNLNSLIRQIEKQGLTKADLKKMLEDE